ncbi:MAG: hypothetical protein MMC23_005858 [Stictis urceolatum]|nr:hypothetical protein [Stictis urceolata]
MASSEPKGLFGLATELFLMVATELAISDLAHLARASKKAQVLTNPYLYYKIHIKTDSHDDTAHFAMLLDKRPEIVPLIHYLHIDEFDLAAFCRLLSFELPSLESITVQHEGILKKQISEEEKSELNRSIHPKPRLDNLSFHITYEDYQSHTFTAEDCILFRHPKLSRICLSYIDFSCLGGAPPDYFLHEGLEELLFEHCDFNKRRPHALDITI